jgi:glycosyltransferase involved in cell wall biosynthesis
MLFSTSTTPKILHIATGNYSPRVIVKEVNSLGNIYDIYVLQAVPLNDVALYATVIPLIFYPKIWQRVMFNYPKIIYYYCKIRPTLVHIHVLELLPLTYFFNLLGTKIIVDVYENMYHKLPLKQVNTPRLFICMFKFFDKIARRKFHFIFAEESYLESYQNLSKSHVILLNYPVVSMFSYHNDTHCVANKAEIFYIGQISEARAMNTILKAMSILKNRHPFLKLHLFGYCTAITTADDYQQLINHNNLQDTVKLHGMTAFDDARLLCPNAIMGLALLMDVGDYRTSYPTKMFEYMASGLPVIVSYFPHCADIIQQETCGLAINPEREQQLVEAIDWLICHPSNAKEMGKNGRKAVIERYNWNSEAHKLLTFYQEILAL